MKFFASLSILIACMTMAGVGLQFVKQDIDTTAGAVRSETTATDAPTKSYILQGASTEDLRTFITSVGGNVSREFPIINAVSAMLTPAQAEQLKVKGNLRVQDDRTVNTQSYYGQTWPIIDNWISGQVNADVLHDWHVKAYDVTVAVIDSGVNLGGNIGWAMFHNSYNQQRVPVKYDAISGKESYLYNDDANGHGTHIAGLISSSWWDGTRGHYNGIAPDANILSVKAFDAQGQSSYSRVLDALNWIFENRIKYKIRVVNMSLGAKAQGYYWDDPINQAVMRLWHAGVVIVTSAGNDGEEMGITVPGNNPYVITVGAMSDNGTPKDISDDRLASFSSKGPTLEGFVKPDVLAYGVNIASKMDERFLATSLKQHIYGEHYTQISGTSQAAAIVSGVAALILELNRDLSPDQVKCRIMSTARAATNGEMLAYSPFEQGAGLVDAFEAVFSNENDCANKGLDIEADLLGVTHFVGPAKVDSNGDYYIQTPEGEVYSQGMHWSRNILSLEGMHWSRQSLNLEGMHWSGHLLNLEGMHWSRRAMYLKGVDWGIDAIGVQSLEEIEVQGMHWSKQMNIQSSDLLVAPLDLDVKIPMQSEKWQ